MINTSFYHFLSHQVTHNPDGTVTVTLIMTKPPPNCIDCLFCGDSDGVLHTCELTGEIFDNLINKGKHYVDVGDECPFKKGGEKNVIQL